MKRFLLIILVCTIILGTTACGRNDEKIILGYRQFIIKAIQSDECNKILDSQNGEFGDFLEKKKSEYLWKFKLGNDEFSKIYDKFANNPEIIRLEEEFKKIREEAIQKSLLRRINKNINLSGFGFLRIGMSFNELVKFVESQYTKMSKTGIDNFKYWVEDDKRNKKMGIPLNYKDFFDVTDKQNNSIWGDHFNGSMHLEVDYSANELVTLIRINFIPGRFDEAYLYFIKKYGIPHKTENEVLKNNFGATFDNRKCYWFYKNNTHQLLLQKYYGAIDTGCAIYSILP